MIYGYYNIGEIYAVVAIRVCFDRSHRRCPVVKNILVQIDNVPDIGQTITIGIPAAAHYTEPDLHRYHIGNRIAIGYGKGGIIASQFIGSPGDQGICGIKAYSFR